MFDGYNVLLLFFSFKIVILFQRKKIFKLNLKFSIRCFIFSNHVQLESVYVLLAIKIATPGKHANMRVLFIEAMLY